MQEQENDTAEIKNIMPETKRETMSETTTSKKQCETTRRNTRDKIEGKDWDRQNNCQVQRK